MEIEEKLKRQKEVMEQDTAIVEEQDALLAELKKQIDAEQADVDALEESVTEARKVKKTEEERHRHQQQSNAALVAKAEYLESQYDYTTNVNEMNLEVFKNIVQSNQEVNETVAGFVDKASNVKKEVIKILASKQSF